MPDNMGSIRVDVEIENLKTTMSPLTRARIIAVMILAVVLVVSAMPSRAQTGAGLARQAVDAKTKAELESAREAVWRAWFAGDSVALERLIPSALAAGTPWAWEDRALTFKGARDIAARGLRLVDLRFDSTSIDLRDDVALMRARFTYVLQGRAGIPVTTSGIAAEVFVRENGRWVNPFWYLK